MNPKKIWIVGCSSGIGLEFLKLCLCSNFLVVASSRRATSNYSLLKLKKEYKTQIYLINIDISEEEKIKEKTKEVWTCFNGLDIWFYNAGAYNIMSIDSWDINKFEQMNEVNYLGVVRLMTEIAPYFKAQNKGHWVWNASLSSYFGLPQAGAYSAPKAALVNLAQSLQPELDLINIKLQIINHGFVKTKLTAKNKFKMPQLMEAEFTARKIFESIKNPNSFEITFPYFLRFLLKFLRFLPYKISLKFTKRIIG